MSAKPSTVRPFHRSIQGCITCAAIILALLFAQLGAWTCIAYASTPTKSIADATVSPVSTQAFTGEKIKPKVKVTYDGKALKRGRDYTLSYVDNVRPGKAKVIIKGEGAFGGVLKCPFIINAKYVMVGDSYALAGGSSTSWPARVAKRLCLPRKNWSLLAANGYGFATGSFVDLVNNAKRDQSVSDVLIVGGAGNDLTWSIKEVTSGYKKTIAVARKKWPNARIIHAIPNWWIGKQWYQSTITSRYDIYHSLAKTRNVQYLPKCERILSGRQDCMFADGNHPNAKGANTIADAVVKGIRKWDRRPKDYRLRRVLGSSDGPLGSVTISQDDEFLTFTRKIAP